jgi:tripartite-type tricarboxylate transporter receptor subunit TctC
MKFRAILAFVVAVFAGLSITPQADAQSWPQRNVKIIVALGPGSGVDIAARLFADRLTAVWGKPVVVENRPGGDGFVAITGFIGAHDDHTLLFSPTATFTAHPFQHEKLPYDAKDLIPIARVSNTLVTIAVPAASEIKSIKDLVETARAQPGKLNWAGITGALDFMFAAFLKNENLKVDKVPYRDNVQALNDLAEGRIQVYVAALAIVRPQVLAGKVRLIAFMNHERAPSAADVPTVREAGFPALEMDGLTGLFGSREMPADVQKKIAEDVRAIASDPEIISKLGVTGQLVRAGTPEEFAAAIAEQQSRVATAAASLGIKPAQQ